MKNPTIHYWDVELVQFQDVPEASPCGDSEDESIVSHRFEDITCPKCVRMISDMMQTSEVMH